MPIQIKKAVRQRVWLKIAVMGPSGSGKTWGAISLAKGLAPTGKILVIDTENESASLYADKWDFDVISMHEPFTTQKYAEALNAAVENGYEAVVIDSLTHEWAASGGILDQKASKDARGGNGFSNWNEMKQVHNRFVERMLQSKIHVIATLRSKTEYVQEQDERGKTQIRKVGLAPVTSDGMEYEFSLVLDVDRNTHLATASKDRTSLFEGRSLLIEETVGRELRAWRESGAELGSVPIADTPELPPAPTFEWTEDDHRAFGALADLAYDTLPEPDAIAMQTLYDGQRKGGEEPSRVLGRFNTALTSAQAKLPKTPEANAAALAQMVEDKRNEPKAPVSAEADVFVEGVSPTPLVQKDPKGAITIQQFGQLCDVCKAHQVPLDKLEVYSRDKGYLAGDTLSTMRAESYAKLMPLLLNENKRRAIVVALNAVQTAA